MFTPIPWRDGMGLRAAEEMAALQRDEMCVLIEKMTSVVGSGRKGGLLGALETMEEKISKTEKERERVREKEEEKEREMRIASSENPPTPSLSSSLDFPTAQLPTTPIDQELLVRLEALHKILVMYMWSHFKNSVVYPDRDIAESLKGRVEVALDWGLREFGRDTVRAPRQRGEGVDSWSTKGGTEEVQEKQKKKRKGKKEKRVKRKGRKGDEAAMFSRDGPRLGEDDQGGFRSFENLRSSSFSAPAMKLMVAPQLGGVGSSSSSAFYAPPVAVGSMMATTRSSGVASAIMSMKNGGNVNHGHGGGGVQQSAGWKQAPDLTALLKMYVDSPSLRVGGGGGGGQGQGQGQGDVRK